MPKNWKTYKLSEIVDQNRGISYGIVQPGKHDLNGIPILKVNNLTNKSFDLKDLHFVSKKVESKYKRTRLTGGEILLSLVGTLGEVFIVPENLVGLNVVRALAVIPVINKYSPIWVEYYLKSPKIQDRLKQIATTSVQATINLKELREVEILLPEKKEREAIASILSALDDKIENNLAMNKTLEDMAMALYKHWFVDFGPFQDGKFIDSELGEIPEGWEVKPIGDLVETIGGGTPKTKVEEYWEGGIINWYSPTDLTKSNSLYSRGSAKKITPLGLQKSSAKLFPKGSLLMSSRATIGALTINRKEASTNQGFITMIPNEKVCVYQLHGWAVHNMNLIISKSNGSTFKEISKANFRSLPMLSLPKKLSYQIEVSKLYESIENNLLEIDSLTKFRDTLLPKLISGEVRVKDVEQLVCEAL